MPESTLQTARHQVATAESLVISQRQVLAALKDIGADMSEARRLLSDFEGTLANRIKRLAQLVAAAERRT